MALAVVGPSALAQVDDTVGGRLCDESGFCQSIGSKYGLRQIPAPAPQPVLIADPYNATSRRKFMSFDLTPQLNVKSTNMAYPYNESATETKNGGERWYALSFALPPSWPLDSTTPVTVASIDVGLVSAGLAPPLAIVVKGRDILLDMHFEQATPDTATSSRKIPVVLDQVRRDTWYCFVIHANWSSTLNSGALMVWNNHELVYQTTRLHNSYKPQYLNVPFVGLSVPEKNDALPRKIYTDVIWLGKPGATTTHKQMRDATPCL